MKFLFPVLLLSSLLSCGVFSPSEEATQQFFEQIKFEEGESGCVDIRGDINIGGNAILGATSAIVYKKSVGENAPSC